VRASLLVSRLRVRLRGEAKDLEASGRRSSSPGLRVGASGRDCRSAPTTVREESGSGRELQGKAGVGHHGIPEQVTRSSGTIAPMGTEETKTEKTRNELAALEQELQRARLAAEEDQAALSALDEQRSERESHLALALRAQQDFERRLEEKRAELARAEAEAALEVLKKELRDRDVAAEAFASAAQSVITRLQDFDTAQEGVEKARQLIPLRGPAEAGAAAAELPDDLDAQPGVFAEALTTLVEIVRQRADRDLERDLVEAAARSPMGHDISRLPAHLQGLARARFVAIGREGRESQPNDA
jgi:hypothetical protein